MCRSEAEGGRRCPSSRGGHSTRAAAQPSSASGAPMPQASEARSRRPFEIAGDITVVTYRDGDGRLAKTAVNGAEFDALKKSGHLVEVHGSGSDSLNGDQAGRVSMAARPNPARSGSLRDVPKPPVKLKSWSEKRYRERYDSSPCTVISPEGNRYYCSGPVSAYVIASSKPGSRVVEGHVSRH